MVVALVGNRGTLVLILAWNLDTGVELKHIGGGAGADRGRGTLLLLLAWKRGALAMVVALAGNRDTLLLMLAWN